MIEQVEELRTEIQTHTFPGQRKLFDNGEIGVNETRTRYRDSIRVPQEARRRHNKAGRVNPLVRAVVGGIEVATRNLVRAVKVVPIAAGVEEDTGLVIAVDQRVRKPRGNFFDQRQLPVPQKRVRSVIPSIAELLAFAERQVINDATREVVIEVDLRQPPIELLLIREREIRRTQQGTQTVGQAIIVGARIGVTKQSVQSVPVRLSLGFDLQRVVSCLADIAEKQNRVKYRIRWHVG